MDEAFELLDPQAAQAFLKHFPAEVRRKGEACFRAGYVQDLVPVDPGREYSAVVRDNEDCEVVLSCDSAAGWAGTCSCPKDTECEHMFAVMSALLAEHRAVEVQGLSSGFPGALARLVADRHRQKTSGDPSAGPLAELVASAAGRALTGHELRFLRSVHSVYARCCENRQITSWDFQQMG